MHISVSLFVLVAAAVSAQQTYSSELNMKIDPNSVPAQTRAIWCHAQTNTCGLLCGGNTIKNGCNSGELIFECTCAPNDVEPGLQYYTQTVPTFICETLFSQCNTEQVGNIHGQKACTDDTHKLCGKIPPPKSIVVLI